ncbi:NucA/NucB deoxyribonuclease domain-containing protein [Actinokineospora inagensis]|uniref:NucA/NucB deoxyribonuclease domain-containing protein n=1 Tax=Actinokineospora inagensis TaxID=103730 RepID=UPI0003FDCF9A|nr:hypothetical protein [Actinokineospora inagensis]
MAPNAVASAASLGQGVSVVRSFPMTKESATSVANAPVPELGSETGGHLSARTSVADVVNPPQQVYRVDSSKYATAAVSPFATPGDPISPQECVDRYLGGFSGPVLYKNRFAACHSEFLVVDYYSCSGGGCKPVGRAAAKWAATWNMSWNAREFTVTGRLWDWTIVGNVPLTVNLGVEFACGTPGVPGTTAKCNYPEYGWSKSIQGWRTSDTVTTLVKTSGEDPANPHDPTEVNGEKRTFYALQTYAYTYGGPGPYERYSQTTIVTTPFRCDIARSQVPQYAKSSDCVFHAATGWFTLNVNDPAIHESAQLIYDAHNNIGATYPGNTGKYIPGKIGVTEPLSRLYYDKRLRDLNNTTAYNACVAHWGPNFKDRPDGGKNDCDEFPFATTYEGAGTVTDGMLRTYAVRPVLNTQNQAAGSRLSLFLSEDHLLDGDNFYVTANL